MIGYLQIPPKVRAVTNQKKTHLVQPPTNQLPKTDDNNLIARKLSVLKLNRLVTAPLNRTQKNKLPSCHLH